MFLLCRSCPLNAVTTEFLKEQIIKGWWDGSVVKRTFHSLKEPEFSPQHQWLTTACDTISSGSNTLFWPPQGSTRCVHTKVQTRIGIKIKYFKNTFPKGRFLYSTRPPHALPRLHLLHTQWNMECYHWELPSCIYPCQRKCRARKQLGGWSDQAYLFLCDN